MVRASPTDDACIDVRGLSKRYGQATALADLTMRVPYGQTFGFLGPNGAGKTTAVRLLVGLTAASAGQGLVLGAPLGDLAARRRIGYAPELFRHPPWLTGREILDMHAALAAVAAGERRREVDRVLALVGLSGREAERVSGYSKGMQQRLALAAALLGRPALVVLDEPTSALDPVGRRDVREIIRTLKAEGTTVFLNSHLLSEVEAVCDRVAVVRSGRVVASGTLDDLRGAPQVRIRLEAPAPAVLQRLATYGPAAADGEGWVTVDVGDLALVPDLVAAAVAGGGRVTGLETRKGSLEDRLIELLGAGRL